MNIDTLIWCLLVVPAMSWPVWLVGGVGYVVLWRVSKNWHWLNKFLARTFLVALTIAPAFFGGHPPGFGPAVYIFLLQATGVLVIIRSSPDFRYLDYHLGHQCAYRSAS